MDGRIVSKGVLINLLKMVEMFCVLVVLNVSVKPVKTYEIVHCKWLFVLCKFYVNLLKIKNKE